VSNGQVGTTDGGVDRANGGRGRISAQEWVTNILITVFGVFVIFALVFIPLQRARVDAESETFFSAVGTVLTLKQGGMYPDGDLREMLVTQMVPGLSRKASLYPRLAVRRTGNGHGVDVSARGLSWVVCTQIVDEGAGLIVAQLSVNGHVVDYDKNGSDRGKHECRLFHANEVTVAQPL